MLVAAWAMGAAVKPTVIYVADFLVHLLTLLLMLASHLCIFSFW